MSEREMIERERRAFRRALFDVAGWTMPATEAAVNSYYPLPKVTRSRVVRDPSMWMDDRQLWWRCGLGNEILGCYVHPSNDPHRAALFHPTDAFPTPDRVRLWADLLANPTETVEAP